MEVGLSLGSNVGDRQAYLLAALKQIEQIPGTRLLAVSAVYETEPVDVTPEHEDKPFLNAVVVIDTSQPLEELAREAHAVEDRLGRVRTSDPNAPRPIDVDLLYAEDLQMSSETLTLPHPRWNERRFVVQPMADVRADLVLPGETRSVREVLSSLPATPDVVLYSRDWTEEEP